MTDPVAFTITLKPLWHSNASQSVDFFVRKLQELLNDITYNYYFVVELTKMGVPHFHGVMNLTSFFVGRAKKISTINIKFNEMLKGNHYFGFSLIKHMEKPFEWVKYMFKDIENTNDYFVDKFRHCAVQWHENDAYILAYSHLEFSHSVYDACVEYNDDYEIGKSLCSLPDSIIF